MLGVCGGGGAADGATRGGGAERERLGAGVGALEPRLSGGFESRSPPPDAELAARLDSGGLPWTLQLRPPPLGPPRRWGPGTRAAWG